MFDMSQEELIALNPALSEGVVEGMSLKVPATLAFSSGAKKEYAKLSKNTGLIPEKN